MPCDAFKTYHKEPPRAIKHGCILNRALLSYGYVKEYDRKIQPQHRKNEMYGCFKLFTFPKAGRVNKKLKQ